VIWESNSAVRYLSAKYAAGTLWPNDPGQRSEADRWMDWQLSTISESMRVVFWGLIRTPAEHFTMGDIPVGCFVHRYHALDIERPALKNLRAWYDRLATRPAYAKHIMVKLT
jgi:glutathione S-transferase